MKGKVNLETGTILDGWNPCKFICTRRYEVFVHERDQKACHVTLEFPYELKSSVMVVPSPYPVNRFEIWMIFVDFCIKILVYAVLGMFWFAFFLYQKMLETGDLISSHSLCVWNQHPACVHSVCLILTRWNYAIEISLPVCQIKLKSKIFKFCWQLATKAGSRLIALHMRKLQWIA